MDIASESFKQSLTKFEVSDSDKSRYVQEVSTMEKARFMNMRLLAIVYKFMEDYQIVDWNTITGNPAPFSADNTIPYTDLLIQSADDKDKMSAEDLYIYRIETRDEMLRYMIVIFEHRSRPQPKVSTLILDDDEYEEDNYGDDESIGPDEDEDD
jgi:hypothetical protein